MKKYIETTITHPACSNIWVVRTEYEWEGGAMTYQSTIQGADSRLHEFEVFLQSHRVIANSLMGGMSSVFAQHHKIECYLWAKDWIGVAIYGLQHPIEYLSRDYYDGKVTRIPV